MSDAIPLPPPELRTWVGPVDPADYDNPSRTPLLRGLGIADAAHERVFDFGCGCGRQARQLLIQTPRPHRYVGIDVHRVLVEWCRENLTPCDPHFSFVHHDVFSPWYAPGNSLKLAQPFPVGDGEFTLVLASSVFTHLSQPQIEWYLSEIARVLSPDGVAYTSWLLFDRIGFPFLPDVYTLYVRPVQYDLAVLCDREWLLQAIRRVGLAVLRTIPPSTPGHQWTLLLGKRRPESIDQLPLGREEAEWVSGATRKAIADNAAASPLSGWSISNERPALPGLSGHLATLDETRKALDEILQSKAWRLACTLAAPVRRLRTWRNARRHRQPF